jgi:NTP pyrophosphatase (non-canonical NTP hydrolase)
MGIEERIVGVSRDNFNAFVIEGASNPLDLSALQARLAAWQQRNFGVQTPSEMALGIAEETGELARAVLKNAQRIRGYDDQAKFLAAAADALADIAIYSINLATILRLDYGTLLRETAHAVMSRDWVADRVNADKKVEGSLP